MTTSGMAPRPCLRLSRSPPARSSRRIRKRRRRVEFLGFMNSLVAAFRGRELHVILDNLNTHKKNERWLKKHPKVHFHFVPTRSSWLNQVETWFSILQGQSLNGASFTAVEQLQEHIDAFIAAYMTGQKLRSASLSFVAQP